MWILHFDGGCEPTNPGGWMSRAWLLLRPGQDDLDGVAVDPPDPANTNNRAEWLALLDGLRALADLGESPGALSIRGDSQLVVRQLSGDWKCREPLAALRDECLGVLERIGCQWTAVWIPREHNERCDAIGRAAYEKAKRKKIIQRAEGLWS